MEMEDITLHNTSYKQECDPMTSIIIDEKCSSQANFVCGYCGLMYYLPEDYIRHQHMQHGVIKIKQELQPNSESVAQLRHSRIAEENGDIKSSELLWNGDSSWANTCEASAVETGVGGTTCKPSLAIGVFKDKANVRADPKNKENVQYSSLKTECEIIPSDEKDIQSRNVVANNHGMETVTKNEDNMQSCLPKTLLAELRKKHPGARPYKCDVCGSMFKHFVGVRRHRERHNGEKPHKCDVCGKAFTTKHYLKTHLRFHTGEKPYTCAVCGKTFTTSMCLYSHTKMHQTDRPYVCCVCGKGYKCPRILSRHEVIHTGQRPYKCDVCEKSFTHPNTLRKHKLIHTNIKPFKCDLCGKEWLQFGALKTHMKSHTGERPYKCDVCGKAFKTPSQIKTHEKSHSDAKPHTCDKCASAFKLPHQLRAHQKTHR